MLKEEKEKSISKKEKEKNCKRHQRIKGCKSYSKTSIDITCALMMLSNDIKTYANFYDTVKADKPT